MACFADSSFVVFCCVMNHVDVVHVDIDVDVVDIDVDVVRHV